MGGTISYNRPKSTSANSTGLAITILAAEKPATLAALVGGDSMITQVRYDVDADESVGADVQPLVTFEIRPVIDETTGVITFEIACQPKYGSGVDGPETILRYAHPQTADAFQTAAGRARQP
jgi:hypothetical protein